MGGSVQRLADSAVVALGSGILVLESTRHTSVPKAQYTRQEQETNEFARQLASPSGRTDVLHLCCLDSMFPKSPCKRHDVALVSLATPQEQVKMPRKSL